MGFHAIARPTFPRDGSDDRFRDLTVRLGRTCERAPRSVYAAREGSGAQWRTVRRMIHDVLVASGGRALPDCLALLAEFERDARRVAGVEAPRCLPSAICAEAEHDAASDAIETTVALHPTRANVEALLERKLAERDAIEITIEALFQVRDGFARADRRAA